MPLRHGSPSPDARGGYTLIEVMVSTLILGLSMVAMVTMLRKGKTAEDFGEIRRQASVLLRGYMEDTAYHFRKYSAAPGPLVLDDTLYLEGRKILTTGSIRVGAQQTENWPSTSGSNPVLYKRVEGIIRWNLEGVHDSITFTKRIAPVFP